jgi:hypothetical protein
LAWRIGKLHVPANRGKQDAKLSRKQFDSGTFGCMLPPLRLLVPASSAALLVLAFVAAPHSCSWGLAALLGGVVWLAGLFGTNFQLMCRLF